MKIRNVTKKDYLAIHKLIDDAFKTAKVADGTEADFADKMRSQPTYIKDLEMVVEQENKIIAHIMFNKIDIYGDDTKTLLLTIVSTDYDYRHKKIGVELIKKAFEKAGQMGFVEVFLCGDYNYYKLTGFQPIDTNKIKNLSPVPNQHVLVCQLKDGATNNKYGKIDFPS